MSGILKPRQLLTRWFSTCCAVCGFPLYLAGVQWLHAAGRSSFWQCLQILGVVLSLWAVVYRGFWPVSHMTGPFVPKPETASQTNWKLQILEIFNPHKSWLFALRSGVPGALVLGMFSAWLISLQICLLLVTAGCFFFNLGNLIHAECCILSGWNAWEHILYFPLFQWTGIEVPARSNKVPVQYMEQKHLWDESKGVRSFLRGFIPRIIFTAVGSQL